MTRPQVEHFGCPPGIPDERHVVAIECRISPSNVRRERRTWAFVTKRHTSPSVTRDLHKSLFEPAEDRRKSVDRNEFRLEVGLPATHGNAGAQYTLALLYAAKEKFFAVVADRDPDGAMRSNDEPPPSPKGLAS